MGLDPDPKTIANLRNGKPPILEAGLDDLIRSGVSSGKLRFTEDIREAVADADFIWVAFDTPVDDEDRADTAYVEDQIRSLFPWLRHDATVLISSQLPVGSTRRLESSYRESYPDKSVHFTYSPENLRLGKALDVFRRPERIIAGARTAEDRRRLAPLLKPFSDQVIWMSVESAEMTKHALNAFLANSITFINEIARVCEEVGADAKEVEQGLKTDQRIGQRAYLGAGGPFAGGTLARDVSFLTAKGGEFGLPLPLLESIRLSNDIQKSWSRRKLESVLGNLRGKQVAVLGLTYKPGTDTLRRSAAIELCNWLAARHVKVAAFDPVVKTLPEELKGTITLCGSAIMALKNSDAAVVATEWPQFREISAGELIGAMNTPIVLDANRFLEKSLPAAPPLRYVAVGVSKEFA